MVAVPKLKTPPPLLAKAELNETVLFVRLSVAELLKIPPPLPFVKLP